MSADNAVFVGYVPSDDAWKVAHGFMSDAENLGYLYNLLHVSERSFTERNGALIYAHNYASEFDPLEYGVVEVDSVYPMENFTEDLTIDASGFMAATNQSPRVLHMEFHTRTSTKKPATVQLEIIGHLTESVESAHALCTQLLQDEGAWRFTRAEYSPPAGGEFDSNGRLMVEARTKE